MKVAACQVPDIQENTEGSLAWIEKFAKEAEAKRADIVCFPECFLQGYLTDESLVKKYALGLDSQDFSDILKRLAKFKPMLVVGLIEKVWERFFNTAVVIKNGQVMGKYRKTHLLDGEQIFTAGSSYPVFEIGRSKFGINICYDMQFPEATTEVAKQGATLIICPANNMMNRGTAEKYKHLHHEMRSQRAKEAGVWIVSADVTGKTEERIAYGPTSVLDPKGEVVAQVPLLETGMIVVNIP
jgi:5-aminopentanamidase